MGSSTPSMGIMRPGRAPHPASRICPNVRAVPRIIAVSALILLSAACGLLITDPDLSHVTGPYDIELMDGNALPVKVGSGACPLEVYRGEISLAPRVANRRPLYTVGVFLRFSCDTTRFPPPGESELVDDFGKWSLRGNRVEFRSERGHGVYVVPIEATSVTGAPGPALNLLLDGHRFAFRRIRPYGEF